MKKVMLVGRSECGKTTLRQALKGGVIQYHKTQYINHYDVVIDTPGEYAETHTLGRALALYSYECDVIALLLNAAEPFSLYPPCVAATANRPVIGIVTQIDNPNFHVSPSPGEGIWQVLSYLKEPGDVLPWESEEEAERHRQVLSNKYGPISKAEHGRS